MTDATKEPAVLTVPDVLLSYRARIFAITDCATVHIAHAQDHHTRRIKSLFDKMVAMGAVPTVDAEGKTKTISISAADVGLMKEVAQLLPFPPHTNMLARSMLIYGFSIFDAFLGSLLRALFHEDRQLIHTLEEKEMKVSEVLSCNTVQGLLDRLIERDISNLLRESYEDLFDKLATRHKLTTLTKFENWPVFVECSQRRNLITHCDGVVNNYYLDKCNAANAPVETDCIIGTRLEVTPEYLTTAFNILYEVGVMLAHTLWRKTSPERTEESEKELTSEIYELLLKDHWYLARRIGQFAVGLPKKKSDIQNKLIRINYAQALKWGGDNSGALRQLDDDDWSASVRDLRLAVEVIRGNYAAAATLMRQIGKNGEYVDINGYRQWPLFREFRDSSEYAIAFVEIYGEPPAPLLEAEPLRPIDAIASNATTDVATNEQPDSSIGELTNASKVAHRKKVAKRKLP